MRVEQTDDCEISMYGTSECKVVVDKVVLADAKCPVTVTLYQDGVEIGFGVDSVESYVARAEENNADTMDLNIAILKFAASAYTYLGGTN